MVCASIGVHIFFSCGDDKPKAPFSDIDTNRIIQPSGVKPEEMSSKAEDNTVRFTAAVNDMYDSYGSISYSMYYNDTTRVRGAVNMLLNYMAMTENLLEQDPKFKAELSEEKMNAWNDLKVKIYIQANHVKNAFSIEAKRKEYSILSDLMLQLVTEFGLTKVSDINVYYCQKALDGQGAYWINRVQNEDYMNPYSTMEQHAKGKDSCMTLVKTFKFD